MSIPGILYCDDYPECEHALVRDTFWYQPRCPNCGEGFFVGSCGREHAKVLTDQAVARYRAHVAECSPNDKSPR